VPFDPKENIQADLLATHLVDCTNAFSNIYDALSGEPVTQRVLILAAARMIAAVVPSTDKTVWTEIKNRAVRLLDQQAEGLFASEAADEAGVVAHDSVQALVLDDCGLTSELLGEIEPCDSCGMRHAPHDEPEAVEEDDEDQTS
jgi:hypothetical protein